MIITLTSRSKDSASVLRSARCSDGARIARGGYSNGCYSRSSWFAVSAAGELRLLGRSADHVLEQLRADSVLGVQLVEVGT